MKKKLLGYYDYTVILTYCGMLFAFKGIILAIKGMCWNSLLCLMIAGICDMFDGAVASTKDRTAPEKRFGIQIDSLSDLVSFCILPAVFVYMLLDGTAFATTIVAIYVLAGLIRLAYFNVLEEERQGQTTEKRTSYLGMPVTTIALLLPAMYLLYDYKILFFRNKITFLVLLGISAVGFLIPIEIKKPKIIGKIVLVVVGFVEAVMMTLVLGWGAA